MIWKELISTHEVERLAEDSSVKPVLVFKHSTRCSISSVAKSRMESRIDELKSWADVYLLNLIEHRDVSKSNRREISCLSRISSSVINRERGMCVR